MPTEKELQIAPIVPESLMHNAKVRFILSRLSPVVQSLTLALLDVNEPPIPHSLPPRRLSRHPRPRVLQRLSLLPHLHHPHHDPVLRPARGAGVDEVRSWALGYEPVFPLAV